MSTHKNSCTLFYPVAYLFFTFYDVQVDSSVLNSGIETKISVQLILKVNHRSFPEEMGCA